MNKYQNPFKAMSEAVVLMNTAGINTSSLDGVLGIRIDRQYGEGKTWYSFDMQVTKECFSEMLLHIKSNRVIEVEQRILTTGYKEYAIHISPLLRICALEQLEEEQ